MTGYLLGGDIFSSYNGRVTIGQKGGDIYVCYYRIASFTIKKL